MMLALVDWTENPDLWVYFVIGAIVVGIIGAVVIAAFLLLLRSS